MYDLVITKGSARWALPSHFTDAAQRCEISETEQDPEVESSLLKEKRSWLLPPERLGEQLPGCTGPYTHGRTRPCGCHMSAHRPGQYCILA